jgi:dolichyl-phosphate beta-glucosyltransferase
VENLSIIIPFYNEEKRLKKSFKILNNFLLNRKNAEIIFVNDGSNDQSENIIHNFIYNFKKKKSIRYIAYKKNIGKGYAVKKGILNSKKDWILICDADMSVQPNQLNQWFKKKLIINPNKAYFGSRKHTSSKVKTSPIRELLGIIFNLIINFLFDIKIRDTQCGYKLFNKKYAKSIFRNISSYRFSFDIELVLLLKKKNIEIKELPVIWKHKPGSKLNIFYDIPIMLLDIFKIKLKKLD